MSTSPTAVLLKIKTSSSTFTRKEQSIAQLILSDPVRASRMTISEMSDELGVADSTIFKFAKHLGYQGFRDFRDDLLADAFDPQVSVHENISERDDISSVAQAVFQSSIKSLEDTLRLQQRDALDKAVQILLSSKRVSFHGCGGSNAVAYDSYQKFLRSPLQTVFAQDYHLQLMQASLLGPEDCAIVISHTGLTKEMVRLAGIVKKAGVRTIVITSYPSEHLQAYADVVLVSVSDETGYRSESLSSRISQLALVDTLYTAVMFHVPNVSETLHKMRRAIATTKLDDTGRPVA
ncbi:MurR/RpiR family transcriptional regulator [Olsenella sp. HMSC062G07]|uniref:MurR/RpiR family transcriptional regulator n=1 Tax=Olsenella sp. HMSC062G07 TaxID=1739330 RepID=UPI0008A60806|nr:MurR/RpiR family transcriptional regulator [Olsenella sp. HMSC062G07]OFK23694.1 RpiR family transcriptional regulator [Olsenella sp. HMSC062G07]